MFELRRQIFHVFLGIALVLLIYFDLVGVKFLVSLSIFGLILSFLSNKFKIPVIELFLKNFEREKALFRGQGVITCVLGALIVLVLFEKEIALASILVLSLGDSFCHLGKYGKFRLPFNDVKFLEGLLIGIIIATLGALIFVNFWQAFLGSLFAMVVESFDLKIKKIEMDDNILIPLVSGIVMSLVLLL